jgi:hypothetical protein
MPEDGYFAGPSTPRLSLKDYRMPNSARDYNTLNFASSRIHSASWRSNQTLRSNNVVA